MKILKTLLILGLVQGTFAIEEDAKAKCGTQPDGHLNASNQTCKTGTFNQTSKVCEDGEGNKYKPDGTVIKKD